LALRTAYTNAQSHHVSVLAAAGDDGSTSASNAAGTRYFTSPVANWPATDPLVTAVGGTQLHLGAKGARLRPDNVWNDTTRLGELAAGGGGTSSVFARPTWQQSVASVVGDHRGMPDVSLSAAVVGSVLIYSSFSGAGSAGYYLIGGTSEATPLFAGVVAVADQAAGHPLGFLNPTLYRLAAAKSPGLVDVTLGDNTVSFAQGAKTVTVPGYHAAAGYDLASGLGTVDGSKLVNELAAAGS
jgi:subtilase family serine protease